MLITLFLLQLHNTFEELKIRQPARQRFPSTSRANVGLRRIYDFPPLRFCYLTLLNKIQPPTTPHPKPTIHNNYPHANNK